MPAAPAVLTPAEAMPLAELIAFAPQGIASRVLSRNQGGSVTLFAFDVGQGLSEHSSPYDALVQVLEGTFSLTIGGVLVAARTGDIVRMPANVPHAVDAEAPSRMLLTMLKG